jgi:hypothetical protein
MSTWNFPASKGTGSPTGNSPVGRLNGNLPLTPGGTSNSPGASIANTEPSGKITDFIRRSNGGGHSPKSSGSIHSVKSFNGVTRPPNFKSVNVKTSNIKVTPAIPTVRTANAKVNAPNVRVNVRVPTVAVHVH